MEIYYIVGFIVLVIIIAIVDTMIMQSIEEWKNTYRDEVDIVGGFFVYLYLTIRVIFIAIIIFSIISSLLNNNRDN